MLHEDILWTTQLALVAQRIGFCATPFYGYRTNPDSITNSPSMQALLRRANSYVDIINALVKIAASTKPPVRDALLSHANQESGHLLGLLRKNYLPHHNVPHWQFALSHWVCALHYSVV